MSMNKAGLITELKKKAAEEQIEMSEDDVKAIVNLFFDSIAESLVRRDRIEIRGLWSFFVKEYEGYTGRNPKTGEQIEVKPKVLPFFKCGKELRERVDI